LAVRNWRRTSAFCWRDAIGDGPTNLVLETLRAVRGDLAEMKADVIEVKERLGLIQGHYASVSRRLDRLSGDMEQVRSR
jgi:predicted nuclease with TOPRIM domain